MASLIHMQKILSSRMHHFSTIEKAVSYAVIEATRHWWTATKPVGVQSSSRHFVTSLTKPMQVLRKKYPLSKWSVNQGCNRFGSRGNGQTE